MTQGSSSGCPKSPSFSITSVPTLSLVGSLHSAFFLVIVFLPLSLTCETQQMSKVLQSPESMAPLGMMQQMDSMIHEGKLLTNSLIDAIGTIATQVQVP